MSETLIEELNFIRKPRGTDSREQMLRFGVARYSVECPGVSCSRQDMCPAKSYSGRSRHFGPIPTAVIQHAQNLRVAGRYNIPIGEFEALFGERRPTETDPAGFVISPAARAGDLSLVLPSQTDYDILWPIDSVSLIVSERVVRALQENNILGAIYHLLARTKVLGDFPWEELRDEDERKRNMAWERLWSEKGTRSDVAYYELEASGVPADCGIRWKLNCQYCGHILHDCRRARIRGRMSQHNGNDFFRMFGLGAPVCTQHMVDILRKLNVSMFETEPVDQVIAELIEEYG